MIHATYKTKRGGSAACHWPVITDAELLDFIMLRLRNREQTVIKVDGLDEPVGGAFRVHGGDRGWRWWFDQAICTPPVDVIKRGGA